MVLSNICHIYTIFSKQSNAFIFNFKSKFVGNELVPMMIPLISETSINNIQIVALCSIAYCLACFTVMLNECGQFVSVWCKIGVFWSSKKHLKSPVILWSRKLTMGVRSFQRGTVGLCRSKGCKVTNYQSGCKVTNYQSWRMILSSRSRTRAARILALLWPNGRIFFKPPTLTDCNFAALWSTKIHSISLKRSWTDWQHIFCLRNWQHF